MEIRIHNLASNFANYATTAKGKTLSWSYEDFLRALQLETMSQRLLVAIIEAIWDCNGTVDVSWDGKQITVRVM